VELRSCPAQRADQLEQPGGEPEEGPSEHWGLRPPDRRRTNGGGVQINVVDWTSAKMPNSRSGRALVKGRRATFGIIRVGRRFLFLRSSAV
jgi:hypothetical protein